MADELISRQAAKEAVKYIPWCDWKAVGDCLDELSAVDAVEVVHGRWIFGHTIGHAWMKCSECLKSQMPNGCFTYCPNCGAKMDGELEG